MFGHFGLTYLVLENFGFWEVGIEIFKSKTGTESV
jgi:hypothetical protein